jgi:hypothetical protein
MAAINSRAADNKAAFLEQRHEAGQIIHISGFSQRQSEGGYMMVEFALVRVAGGLVDHHIISCVQCHHPLTFESKRTRWPSRKQHRKDRDGPMQSL